MTDWANEKARELIPNFHSNSASDAYKSVEAQIALVAQALRDVHGDESELETIKGFRRFSFMVFISGLIAGVGLMSIVWIISLGFTH